MAESEPVRWRRVLPDVRLVQAMHVAGPQSVDEAGQAAAFVDTLLPGPGSPRLPAREPDCGATDVRMQGSPGTSSRRSTRTNGANQ